MYMEVTWVEDRLCLSVGMWNVEWNSEKYFSGDDAARLCLVMYFATEQPTNKQNNQWVLERIVTESTVQKGF